MCGFILIAKVSTDKHMPLQVVVGLIHGCKDCTKPVLVGIIKRPGRLDSHHQVFGLDRNDISALLRRRLSSYPVGAESSPAVKYRSSIRG
jgi:hypothetical protein